jgi:hypothetical protein
MIAHRGHKCAIRAAQGGREQIVVALHHQAQVVFEAAQIPLTDKDRAVGRQRLSQSGATVAHRTDALRGQPDEHRHQQQADQ